MEALGGVLHISTAYVWFGGTKKRFRCRSLNSTVLPVFVKVFRHFWQLPAVQSFSL